MGFRAGKNASTSNDALLRREVAKSTAFPWIMSLKRNARLLLLQVSELDRALPSHVLHRQIFHRFLCLIVFALSPQLLTSLGRNILATAPLTILFSGEETGREHC